MQSTFTYVHLQIVNRVAWLRFNRPPRNSVHWEMLFEFVPAIEAMISRDDVGAIVLGTQIDGYFSTGADISAFANATPEKMTEWIAETHRLAQVIRSCPKPILAAIRGVAVGGGLEMALHVDLRFAASNARLGQPEINLAFIPPVGGTQGLVRLVGRGEAFKMLYGGHVMDAASALKIGLVDFVIEPDDLTDTVQRYAEELATKPSNALCAIRRCVIDGGERSFEEGLAIERSEAIALAAHDNFREGCVGFLGKAKSALVLKATMNLLIGGGDSHLPYCAHRR